MRRLRLATAVLALFFAPFAAAAAEKDEAAMKKELDELERKNAKLREELAKKKSEIGKLFEDATRAEKAAGLDFRKATAVSSATMPESVPPVSQPPTKHANLRLSEAELTLQMSFGPPRTSRSFKIYGATCDVARKAR